MIFKILVLFVVKSVTRNSNLCVDATDLKTIEAENLTDGRDKQLSENATLSTTKI